MSRPQPGAEGALDEYVALFRSGRFFEAHEVLEQLWLLRDGDPFLQGLIIFAAAYVKVQRGSPVGAAKHFRGALRYLRAYLPEREGFDVAAIAAHAEHCLDRIAAGMPVHGFDMRRSPHPAPPPPVQRATDDEVLRVLREVAAGRAAGEDQAPTVVKETLLRMRGRAGRAQVMRLARALRA
jgi:hypothetical protein